MSERPPVPPRTAEACLLCRCHWTGTEWRWPKAQTGYRTCQPCEVDLGDTLRTIRDDIPLLSPERWVYESRSEAAGFRSVSPANDLAIALTDRRNSAAIRPGDVPDMLGLLHSWAQLVREEAKLSPGDGPATPATEVGVLLGHLPWICRQGWVDEFATEIQALLISIRAGNGESEGKVRIGACPDCRRALEVRLTATVIRCPCGATWPRQRWELLGRALRAEVP